VRFRNGALGVLHATRWATGQINTVALRVYGDKGALDLNHDRPPPETLRVCLGKDIGKDRKPVRWRPVRCPPVPNMYQRFVTALQTGKQGQTSFAGATKVQAYLHASAVSARRGGRFVILG
jgi:predicted dehydrogenase